MTTPALNPVALSPARCPVARHTRTLDRPTGLAATLCRPRVPHLAGPG
jgi:hypothetical protein